MPPAGANTEPEDTSLIGSVLSTKKWKSPFKKHSHSSSRGSNSSSTSSDYPQSNQPQQSDLGSSHNDTGAFDVTGGTGVGGSGFAGAGASAAAIGGGAIGGSEAAYDTPNAKTYSNTPKSSVGQVVNEPPKVSSKPLNQERVPHSQYTEPNISGKAVQDSQRASSRTLSSVSGSGSGSGSGIGSHYSKSDGRSLDDGKGRFYDPKDVQGGVYKPETHAPEHTKKTNPTAVGAAKAAYGTSSDKGYTKGTSAYVDEHQLKDSQYKKIHGHSAGTGAYLNAGKSGVVDNAYGSGSKQSEANKVYKTDVTDAAYDTGRAQGQSDVAYKSGVADAAYSSGKTHGEQSQNTSSKNTNVYPDSGDHPGVSKEINSSNQSGAYTNSPSSKHTSEAYSSGIIAGAHDAGKAHGSSDGAYSPNAYSAGQQKGLNDSHVIGATGTSGATGQSSQDIESIKKKYDSELSRIEAEIAQTERELKNIHLSGKGGNVDNYSSKNPFVQSAGSQSTTAEKVGSVPIVAGYSAQEARSRGSRSGPSGISGTSAADYNHSSHKNDAALGVGALGGAAIGGAGIAATKDAGDYHDIEEPYHIVPESQEIASNSETSSKKGGFLSNLFGTSSNKETSIADKTSIIPGTNANVNAASNIEATDYNDQTTPTDLDRGIPGAFATNSSDFESVPHSKFTSGVSDSYNSQGGSPHILGTPVGQKNISNLDSSKQQRGLSSTHNEEDAYGDSSESHGILAGASGAAAAVAAAAASAVGYGNSSDSTDTYGDKSVHDSSFKHASEIYPSKTDGGAVSSINDEYSRTGNESALNTGKLGGKVAGISDSKTRSEDPKLRDTLPGANEHESSSGKSESLNSNSTGFLAGAAAALGYGSSNNDDSSDKSGNDPSYDSTTGHNIKHGHTKVVNDHRSLIQIAEDADPEVKETEAHDSTKSVGVDNSQSGDSVEKRDVPSVQYVSGLRTVDARNASELGIAGSREATRNSADNSSEQDSFNRDVTGGRGSSFNDNSTDNPTENTKGESYKSGVGADAHDSGKRQGVNDEAYKSGVGAGAYDAGKSKSSTYDNSKTSSDYKSGVSAGAFDSGKQDGAKDEAYKSGVAGGAYDAGKSKGVSHGEQKKSDKDDDYKSGIATGAYDQGKQHGVKDEAYHSGVVAGAYDAGKSQSNQYSNLEATGASAGTGAVLGNQLNQNKLKKESDEKKADAYKSGYTSAAYDAGQKSGAKDKKDQEYASGIATGAYDQGKNKGLQERKEVEDQAYSSGAVAGAHDVGREKGLNDKKKQLEAEAEALRRKQFEQARIYQAKHDYQSGYIAGAYDAGKAKGIADAKKSKSQDAYKSGVASGAYESGKQKGVNEVKSQELYNQHYATGVIDAAYDAGKERGIHDSRLESQKNNQIHQNQIGQEQYRRGVEAGAYDLGRKDGSKVQHSSIPRSLNDSQYNVTEVTDGPLRKHGDDIIIEVTGANNSEEARQAALRRAREIESQGLSHDSSKIFVETVEHAKDNRMPGSFV